VSGPPLVTGATGFAGSHLVDQLLDEHDRVAAWAHARGRGVPDSDQKRITWARVDLLDGEAIARALLAVNPSAIYHCAGIADVHSASRASTGALRINALGTHNLLEAVRRCNLAVPVLVTGSALVYKSSSHAIDEDDAIAPSSPYGVSKLAQEMAAARATWCPVLLVRAFNHAGPRQADAFVTSSFARQIAQIEADQRPPVLHVGNLEAKRDITDVRDTVRAYRLLMRRGHPGRPYNVCSGRAYRVADLLEMLIARARVPIRVEMDPARLRPSDTPVVLGSFARLASDTGWRPQIAIEQTLADLLDYWRALTEKGDALRS
jgi:GDP-4-dehydro-6-deoxy-D-mannose reductase